MRACPYCAEKIQEEAAKCRFCGEWLDPAKRPAWSLDFATLGEQLASQLNAAAEQGEKITPQLVESLGAQLEKPAPVEATVEGLPPMGVPAPQSRWEPAAEPAPAPKSDNANWTAQQPSSEGSGQVPAWEPPKWLAPPGKAAPADAAVARDEATTQPEAKAAANEPQFAPPSAAPAVAERPLEPTPGPAPTAQPAPTAEPASVPAPAPAPTAAEARAPIATPAAAEPVPPVTQERASLEEVAARMERLKATADAVQRSLAEKAAERSSSGAGAVEDPGVPAASRPAVEAMGSSAQRSPRPPTRGGHSGTLRSRRTGTMDRLERSILGDDRDDFGDLDAEASGFGSTSFGEAVSARRPVPWTPVIAGAAVVAVIAYFMFGRAETEPTTDPDQEAQLAGATGAGAEEQAPPEGDPTKEKTEAGDEAGTDANGGDTEGGKAEGAPEDGAKEGDPDPAPTEPPPTDEALTEKLAQAQKAYTRRKYDEARTALEEALAMSANHPDALVLLAQVQLEQGEMDPALQTATKCVGVDATKADCWLTIAALQEAKNDAAQALLAWQKYLEHDPKGRYANNAKKAIRRLEKQVQG